MVQVQLVRTIVLVLAIEAVPCAVIAQLQVALLRGVVVDGQQQLVPGARVLLQDSKGGTVAARTTGADGAFLIADVAPGAYSLQVEIAGAVVITKPLVVRGSLPVELVLQVGATLREEVVVRGDAAALTAEQPASLGPESVRHAGGAMPGHRIQRALANLPGFTAEDNGLLHVRGVDDGLLYVQDGIPVYERVDRLFGMPPTASAIASMHVLEGYIPPEFGLKSGGVVEVRSQTGLAGPWSSTFGAGLADRATRNAEGAASGPIGRSAGLMITGSHEQSHRFLDPVDPENLHNTGWAAAGTAQFTWHTLVDLFTATLQAGQTHYEVPHDLEQERAGQDQRQRMTQALASGTWQRLLSDRSVWQLSLYRRHGLATLLPSANDTPVTSASRRAGDRWGALGSATYQRGRHTAKAGFEVSALALDEQFSFAVIDPDAARDADLTDAALAHDVSHPFVFSGRARPSLWSLFAQDVYQASEQVTLNVGVRFDRTRLLVPASQWSPRLGVAYRIRHGTVLRASALRLFQPPQSEYLLLGSSAAARALSPFADAGSGGGSNVPAERQTALDGSLSQDLGPRTRATVSVWRRRSRDVGDPNVFFGTTVTIPNSVARQHGRGVDARLELEPRHGWSAALSYSHTHVDQFGPFTGGLFLEEEVARIQDGTRFTPDHEQRHALSATLAYASGRGWRVAGALRYQTGTPVGFDESDTDDLRGRRGSQVVDFDAGRVRAYAVADVQGEWTLVRRDRVEVAWTAWIENVTNELFAYNFGNAFSGTHFGPRRRVGVGLRASLR